MRYGLLGATECAITLQAGEGEGVLEVLQLGRGDENGCRDTAIRQRDAFMLGGSASEFAEFAPRLSNGIRSRHAPSVQLDVCLPERK
ncbi:hypothetical protein ADL12_09785 [Streptomyces regalis]|uniref:Uncharacterized protein n=1 Tax=Streptomyces regalis TaxID=68262 RepID=A0A0X3VDF8_9ACTN|nr:hypothetical protein ADL12_09785 [Streptomyces regalis]